MCHQVLESKDDADSDAPLSPPTSLPGSLNRLTTTTSTVKSSATLLVEGGGEGGVKGGGKKKDCNGYNVISKK